jgi:spore coat protein U-like protein
MTGWMNRWESLCDRGSLGARCALQAALCCAFLSATPALAGPNDTATTTGSSTAVVVTPLSLVKSKDLDFGRIAPRPTAGTVTLNPITQTCTVTGTIIHAGKCQAAEFVGMGARRMLVRIAVPTTVIITGPGAPMTVTNFTLATSPDLAFVGGNGNGNGAGNRRYQIQPTNGIFDFRVGGRLNVGTNQTGGKYTGTFAVTVQYN